MKYRDIVLYGVYTDLRTEVARRFLGFLWWIIEPVMYMGAFYIVFGLALRQNTPGYVPMLLSGMVVWKWFDGSVRLASNALSANAGIIQQIYVPKYVFALIPILSNTFKFLIILGLLIVALLASGHVPSVHWLGLLPVMLVQLFLIVSIGFLLAAILPLAPDLKQVVDNVLMLMMFLSGVFFSVDHLPEKMKLFFNLNPMAPVITAYRDMLLHNAWPSWASLAYVILVSLPIFAVACGLLHYYDRKYAKLML
ncbi:lipopolysaccharide transport system permease protein [Pseudomonas citronellolis]|uniref:Transport permease protein n=1 Tax=Pseudomonas citronellolis TaxID=53408 RepID=A0AAQ1KEF5_9PSED|nr:MULTISPECIES: ABC transporter permease [Pseudomonas]MCP1606768.1 lipopolysaccharide transport system permease protein [Pseudomonas citronellolis]MCP1657475.1 lipopolysaccharide transport system permease protein [Pseudomonas citronellolis]MCP1724357.1 lipopolysaccharide transport system permease protein [Pseudomonas citronellolis]MED5609410.1 ABC transporter permease [Pseudomonas sp. JH-2]PWU27947.1 ABC transporter permease [Pseudomonas sp. RW407]